jgi:hypothetical protein
MGIVMNLLSDEAKSKLVAYWFYTIGAAQGLVTVDA